MGNKPLDLFFEENEYHFQRLNQFLRSGKEVYIYNTNVKGLPTHFDSSFMDLNTGLAETVVTVRVRCDNNEQVRKLNLCRYVIVKTQYGQYDHWSDNQEDYWPRLYDVKVKLRHIADHPFAGLPSGDLLYGKE